MEPAEIILDQRYRKCRDLFFLFLMVTIAGVLPILQIAFLILVNVMPADQIKDRVELAMFWFVFEFVPVGFTVYAYWELVKVKKKLRLESSAKP